MYGIKVTVKSKGKNFKGLDFLPKSGLLIGILPEDSASTPPDELSNAEKMYINSQGSPAQNIPPRPVIEPVMDRVFPMYLEGLTQAIADTIESDNPRTLMDFYRTMGSQCVKLIKADFRSPVGGRKKNAESTEESKDGSTPLIDTGSMMKAISFKILGRPERKPKNEQAAKEEMEVSTND